MKLLTNFAKENNMTVFVNNAEFVVVYNFTDWYLWEVQLLHYPISPARHEAVSLLLNNIILYLTFVLFPVIILYSCWKSHLGLPNIG